MDQPHNQQEIEEVPRPYRCGPLDFLENIFHIRFRPQTTINEGDKRERKNPHACPIVTLFYDSEKNLSVAVLSRKTESLEVYFQCRVARGTAFQRSPLYYELRGYVRENLLKIRRHEGFFPHSIVVALGALESSDRAQKSELMEEHWQRLRQRHGQRLENRPDPILLENVLEIARLHRLTEDLDIMSLYFMRRTSKLFGRIAAKISRDKMQKISLKLTPFVDGTVVSGYSRFVRRSSSRLVHANESGVMIEYEKCNEIVCDAIAPGVFVPRGSSPHFSWQCEEIALANLHRWWGDIVIRDYVGHKLVLSWLVDPSSADATLFKHDYVPLTVIQLEASPKTGRRSYVASLARITINISASSSSSVLDDVTFSYNGNATVEKIDLEFLCLVRACARSLIAKLMTENQLRLERPMLDHEIRYLAHVKQAAV